MNKNKPSKLKILQKIFLLIIASFFLIKNSNSQITKGNWLVGGSAIYSSINYSSTSSARYKQIDFQISPIIGYFLKDNFAIGIKPSVTYGSNGFNNSSTIIAVGPFVRYYFLKPENIFNLFMEGNYAYGNIKAKNQGPGQKLSTFSFAAGPVFYFNSTVGLEFIISYTNSVVKGFSGHNSRVMFGIGFQIHLEKDK